MGNYKDKLIVIGGHDGQKHLADFHQFDFQEETWSAIEVTGHLVPSPRDSHSASIFGDHLYLFGGSTGAARNDLYEFSFERSAWREVKPDQSKEQTRATGSNATANSNAKALQHVPCARFCHTGVVYNSQLYVFGGYDGQNRLNDFKAFRLGDDINVEIPKSSIVSDMRSMLDDPTFSDITFKLDDGREIHAHKVFCVRCAYFKAMFGGQMRESKQDSVSIKDTSYEVFKSLLEYLYTDEIEIKWEQAMDLFVAADQFGVERLKKLCEKKILVSINNDNAATILQAANMHHATGLSKAVLILF